MPTEPLIKLLTSLDVSFSAEQANTIPGPHQRALFVALALNPNSQISRDWLADLLWPEATQSQARQRLRMTLLNLRKAFEVGGQVSIEANNDAIWLNAATGSVDVMIFESLTENPKNWPQALELYKGNLLSKFPAISEEFDGYLSSRTAQLKEQFLTIALQLLRNAKRGRDTAGFERIYQALLRIDQSNETAAMLAMEYWAGEGLADRVEAVFQHFEASTKKHSGASLDPRLYQAFASLIDQARANPIQSNPSVSFQSTTAAVDRKSSMRKYWIASALAFVALLVSAGFVALQDRFRNAGGPIFLVLRPVTNIDNCSLDAPLESSNGAVLEVLRSIEGSVVVVGNLRRYFVFPNEGVYLVRQHIECNDTRFRATFTFIDRRTRDVAVSFRSSELPLDKQSMASRITQEVDLKPVR
jgi:DNA-binding SARP family transcriptional activator